MVIGLKILNLFSGYGVLHGKAGPEESQRGAEVRVMEKIKGLVVMKPWLAVCLSIAPVFLPSLPVRAEPTRVLKAGDTMTGQLTLSGSTLTVIAPTSATTSLWVSTSPSTPHLYISTTGSVGIGTAVPGAKLGFAAATTAAGGIDFGGDTNIYRDGPGILVSDDIIRSYTYLQAVRSGTTNTALAAKVSGDSIDRFYVMAGGKLNWGDGATADVDLYRDSADKLRTSDSLIIDGNAGIGTTSPGAKLEVVGGSVTFSGSDSNLAIAGFTDAGGNHRVVITTSGYVGIGTTAPEAKLDIAAGDVLLDYGYGVMLEGTSGGNNRTLWNDSSNIVRLQNANDDLRLGAAAADVVTIKSGNVGIGTTGPEQKLHVVGGVILGGAIYVSPTNTNTLNTGYGTAADDSDIWINYRGYNDAQAYFRDFRVGNGKGAQIAMFDGSNGNVGIGTAVPGKRLHIVSAASDDALYIDESSGWSGINFDGVATIRFNTTDKSLNFEAGGTGGAYEKMRIKADGTVGIGTASPTRKLFVNGSAGGTTGWFNDSDMAFKKNISNLNQYGLSTIMSLRPVTYALKTTGEIQIGLIAQEVKPLVPEVVEGEEGKMGIDYAKLTTVLIKAMQEQQREIEELKLKIYKIDGK